MQDAARPGTDDDPRRDGKGEAPGEAESDAEREARREARGQARREARREDWRRTRRDADRPVRRRRGIDGAPQRLALRLDDRLGDPSSRPFAPAAQDRGVAGRGLGGGFRARDLSRNPYRLAASPAVRDDLRRGGRGGRRLAARAPAGAAGDRRGLAGLRGGALCTIWGAAAAGNALVPIFGAFAGPALTVRLLTEPFPGALWAAGLAITRLLLLRA